MKYIALIIVIILGVFVTQWYNTAQKYKERIEKIQMRKDLINLEADFYENIKNPIFKFLTNTSYCTKSFNLKIDLDKTGLGRDCTRIYRDIRTNDPVNADTIRLIK